MKLLDCIPLNERIRVIRDDPPGCLDRLLAWLALWAVRLVVAMAIFWMGYGCRVWVER